jgi:hypothetical protein
MHCYCTAGPSWHECMSVVVRDTIISGGGGPNITLLEGFLASPALPSCRSSMKMYEEDVKMVTVVA